MTVNADSPDGYKVLHFKVVVGNDMVDTDNMIEAIDVATHFFELSDAQKSEAVANLSSGNDVIFSLDGGKCVYILVGIPV